MYPIEFQDNAKISFHPEAQNRLGYCLALNDQETCGVLDQEPVPIHLIEFLPHCQDGVVAIEIAAHSGDRGSFYIFSVDGDLFYERAAAQEAAQAVDTLCSLDRYMWEDQPPEEDLGIDPQQSLIEPDTYFFEETMLVLSPCGNDCNDTHMLFYADAIDESDSIVGVELSVALNETVGFSYCLTYFEDRHCGESPLTWSFVKGGHMTFPCSAHSEGYLIEAPRTEYINGEAQDLPSIWLAYANGEIALTEGETPEALGSMFVCSDE